MRTLAATGIVLALLSSCGGGVNGGLVGHWRTVDAAGVTMELQLNADGSLANLSSRAGCTGQVKFEGLAWTSDAATITFLAPSVHCTGMVVCPDPMQNMDCSFGSGPARPLPYTLSSDRNTLTLNGTVYTRVG